MIAPQIQYHELVLQASEHPALFPTYCDPHRTSHPVCRERVVNQSLASPVVNRFHHVLATAQTSIPVSRT